MQAVTTIGLDIAKSVFQVHGVDAAGQVLIRPPVEASRRPGVLPETASMSGWDQSSRPFGCKQQMFGRQ